MITEKSINKTTVINIVSSIILQGIAFITIPIFSRVLGSEQYGLYSVYNSWVLVISCILGMGVTNSLSTGRYAFSNKYYIFRSSILLFSICISLCLFVFFAFFIRRIAAFIGYEIPLVLLLFFISFGKSIVLYTQQVLIYEKKPIANLFLSVFVSLSLVIISIALVMQNKDYKYKGMIYGMAITYIAFFIICCFSLLWKKPIILDKECCKFGLSVGTPIVFHLLAHNVLSQSDRIMMQNMLIDDSEIGIYSVYYTMVSALNAILSSLNTSWCPFYYDDLRNNSIERIKNKSDHYLELFTVLTVGFILLSREVGKIMGNSEYWRGLNIIPILALSVYFTFMYQFSVNYEFYNQKTRIIAFGTVCAAIMNIVLNLIMIKPWGMFGAALATATSYLSLFIFHYIFVKVMKFSSMPFHLSFRDFLPWICFLIASIIAYYYLNEYVVIRWGCGLIIGVFEVYRIKKRKSIF